MEGTPTIESVDSSRVYENMTPDQLEKDPVASKVLQQKALDYLRTQDKEWFKREYTGEITADGFLVDKKGATNTKPFQSIGGAGFLQVIENTKRELLNDPSFVQPRDGMGLESEIGKSIPNPEVSVEDKSESAEDKLLRLSIAEAPNFRALYTILQENDGIQGSQKHYSFDELTQLIGRVQQGADPKLLTGAFGLRQKVQYLLSLEGSR